MLGLILFLESIKIKVLAPPYRVRGRNVFGTNYSEDGLNSVNYSVVALTRYALYTKVTVNIYVDPQTRVKMFDLLKRSYKRHSS